MSLQGTAPLIAVDGRVLDPWSVTTPVTIRHGRESPSSQAEANTVSFGLIGIIPPEVRMNAPVEVYIAWGEGGIWTDVWDDLWSDTQVPEGDDPTDRITRFRGRITDLNPASQSGNLSAEVVATGPMGDLGRVKAGEEVYPEETEDDRLQRLAAVAGGAGIELLGSGYDWYMAQREIETASVLDILYDTATAAGLVHETVEGVTQFDAWDAREQVESVCFLGPWDLEDSVAWSQQIDAFIKRAVVRYGTPAAGNSEQPQRVRGERGWGKPEAVVSTFLRDAASADILGDLILARWGDDTAFEAPLLNVVAAYIDADVWDAVMGLQFGDVVTSEGVTATPAPLPYGRTEWFVEGWSESWDRQGQGIIQHRLALSVSDRKRFRPDLGEPTWFANVSVSPQEAVYGTVRTVGGLLRTTNDAPVTKGTVFYMDGRNQIGQAGVQPDGSFGGPPIKGSYFQTGDHVLTLVYEGVWPDYLPAVDQSLTVTVLEQPSDPGSPLASIGITATPFTAKEGQPVTVTATFDVTQNASEAGKVQFQVCRDLTNTVWTTIGTVTVRKGQTKASVKWTATQGQYPAQFRATYNPDLANVPTVTSESVWVEVQKKVTKTVGYAATWWGTYEGSGNPWTTTTQAQQGYDTNHKNTKSLFGFPDMSPDWAGWTITKVEVYLRYGKWYGGGTGTARIGSHTLTAKPGGSINTSYYKPGRTNVAKWKQGLGKWVNITGWGKPFATGGIRGIVIGPGTDQSATYHGWANVVGQADVPVIRITGYRWQD